MDGAWEVISQRQTTAIDPRTSGFTKAIEVTFRTREGVVSSVSIPVDQYEVGYVRDQINAHAAQLDAVHNL